MKKSLDDLQIQIKDALLFLKMVQEEIRGDVSGDNLTTAREELANASNAIDDAMGEIDSLLAPEPTRSEWEGV